MGGRRDIKQKNGKILKLSNPAEWYNEARYNLRKNIPGDRIYEKRDLFKALPDHILRKLYRGAPHYSVTRDLGLIHIRV